MGYKEIASLDADVTISLGGVNKKTGKANPKEVEGFYLGNRKIESKKSKSGYAYLHFFQTAKGNVGVWGKTDMDRKLLTATPGAMTKVTFQKMQPTPNGDMYKYSVAQDEDNAIDVSGLSVDSLEGNDGSSEETDAASDDEETNDEQEYTDGNDEDAEQTAALLAAERRAKVQNLLNGKGKSASKK